MATTVKILKEHPCRISGAYHVLEKGAVEEFADDFADILVKAGIAEKVSGEASVDDEDFDFTDEPDAEKQEEKVEAEKPLSDLTKADLLVKAEELGLDIQKPEKVSKKDLILAIEATLEDQGE